MASKPIVLIVEDHPMMRDTLAQLVQLEGMYALTSAHGERVLNLMKQYKPDVVILDVDLGKSYTGIDILRVIKRHPSLRHTPVILHTSESNINALPESKLADLILVKPVDPDELGMFIRRILKARATSA